MDKRKLLIDAVSKNRELILETEAYIWANPETGYREWNTTAYMEKIFENLGYELVKAGNIPGFYTDLDTGRPGPKIAILGELDSLLCGNHPDANPETGAVHACGHHAQCATLVGVAAALKEPGALDGLCGSIRLMAVPAEELIEVGFREGLKEQGIIKYFGGKVEFIYRGYFDEVDMAMMIHSAALPKGKALGIGPGCNGCVVKNITYEGVSAHAGGAPEDGVNALYAATCAINAVNALRETFIDDGHVRFHPIITEAGLAVNAIPERAKMESYVRGASFDTIVKYNRKVNLALAGAAASIGAKVTLKDRPGYTPLNNNPDLLTIAKEAMEAVKGPDSVLMGMKWSTGCTDMGDVSAIMPAIHPYSGGVTGIGHGMDYQIADKDLACIATAQCLAIMADTLLKENGQVAKDVLKNANLIFPSKAAFLAAIDQFYLDKEAVIYNQDGTVTLDYCK